MPVKHGRRTHIMTNQVVSMHRNTKETDISLTLDMFNPEPVSIVLGVPFFEHMLKAMSFHGKIGLTVLGMGDIEVDPHHLVEDVGLVLGDAVKEYITRFGPCARFGHAVIPMDDALSEVAIDVSGRPFLSYTADFPQDSTGDFPLILVNEFLSALANRGGLTMHCLCRYGTNSHHMAESLFKALGKALKQSLTTVAGKVLSTKGSLE